LRESKEQRELSRTSVILTSLEEKVKKVLDLLNFYYIPQYPTRTGYIIDFALPSEKIAIEVDGPHHDDPKQQRRDRFKNYMLKREGWKVIRIHWGVIEKMSIKELTDYIKRKVIIVD